PSGVLGTRVFAHDHLGSRDSRGHGSRNDHAACWRTHGLASLASGHTRHAAGPSPPRPLARSRHPHPRIAEHATEGHTMNDYAGDITAEAAWELLESTPGAILVDVRTEAEWRFVGVPDAPETSHPPVFIEWVTYPDGARNPRFVEQLLEAGVAPGADAPVVFLCRSGQRSIGAAIDRKSVV